MENDTLNAAFERGRETALAVYGAVDENCVRCPFLQPMIAWAWSLGFRCERAMLKYKNRRAV